MQETLVILNPAARSERAKAAWRRIEKLPNCTMRATSAPGDARNVAEAAVKEGFKTIVAAGGDGTVNEVVNGIVGSD
ncbi:MAG TPA: diacylglycerol kinase family protein, partial [Chthoniobacter sp.]|nr:diacylglycerol kinase family protein [Chthoniobacter sp.]